jgi:hypothetical protein
VNGGIKMVKVRAKYLTIPNYYSADGGNQYLFMPNRWVDIPEYDLAYFKRYPDIFEIEEEKKTEEPIKKKR